MRKLIYLLMTMPLFITSCSNDDMAVSEEIVEVNFCAELPKRMGTRATSTLSVDKVYCAVFENGVEITTLREDIDIVEGEPIVFSPRLIKGRTYDVVFWASKEGSYNVDNMTSITRSSNSTAPETDFDAFTATKEITVTGNYADEITLKRPIAQLNMGVTEEDWNGVANSNTFGLTPTTIEITIEGKDTFNALQGVATGSDKSITYQLEVSGSEFICKEKTYKSIAMCYVLAESEKQSINLTYSVYDQDAKAIREDVSISYVPLQRNYKTNVVGGLLTGEITYNISFDNEFITDDEYNKEIE